MKQKITLIVPAYNEGPFIDRCIASIKNQTVPFDQVIFIDDCSTDGTLRKLLKVNRAPVWTVTSTEDNSFRTGNIGKKIREAFPEPSRWEKHA